jgi:RNA polymerase sigma-70 factor (ECF subfamily)
MLTLLILIENSDDKDFVYELYVQYYPIMKKKAFEITRDYSIIDDLINDAFIKLIDKVPLLRSLECCKRTSYIVYTIRNISIDYVRKRARKTERMFLDMSNDLIDSVPDAKLSVEEICVAKEDYTELGKAINQLSERDRDLLYYKYNLELRDKEIANIIGLPANNIREYLTRARRRALKILTKEENKHVVRI